jgi:hypothetical protein
MTSEKGGISIWFFIGSLLTFYGLVILGYGLYALSKPPERTTVLNHLHAEIWWGGFLLLIGVIYCAKFFPSRAE